MRDYRLTTYIEVSFCVKAKNYAHAERIANKSVINLDIDVFNADLTSLTYDDEPAWRIEDDTADDVDDED